MGPTRLVLAVAAGLVSVGCSSGAARAPAARPSLPAATAAAPTTAPAVVPQLPLALIERTLVLVDPTRPTVSRGRTIATTRTLTTLVWAPVVPGPWPLVVFAPGYAVGPQAFSGLLRSWAARGYVVAAPEFPLADPAVAGARLDETDLTHEPDDVRFVLRSLLAGTDPLRGRIDGRRVAVAGHSDGAEVALAIATGPEPPAGPSIRAVIAMSGQPLVGAHRPNPPILVTQGDADTVNAPALGVAVYQGATAPKFLLTLLGGGHLPPLMAGSAWLPTIEAVSGDFLDAYLTGERSRPTRLAAEGNVPSLTTLQGRNG